MNVHLFPFYEFGWFGFPQKYNNQQVSRVPILGGCNVTWTQDCASFSQYFYMHTRRQKTSRRPKRKSNPLSPSSATTRGVISFVVSSLHGEDATLDLSLKSLAIRDLLSIYSFIIRKTALLVWWQFWKVSSESRNIISLVRKYCLLGWAYLSCMRNS